MEGINEIDKDYQAGLAEGRKQALKDIGEWLLRHKRTNPDNHTHYRWEIWLDELEPLKHGEMPK